MTTIVRHGGGSHYMRPDRVYRTSVLQPMVGYRPDVDVQAVAQEFATGPVYGMYADAPGMSGLGQPNIFQRMKLRIQGALASRRAQQFMFAGFGQSPGPAYITGQQVAPQMQAQMVMLSHLTREQNPASMYGAVAEGAAALRNRRPYTYYYAG